MPYRDLVLLLPLLAAAGCTPTVPTGPAPAPAPADGLAAAAPQGIPGLHHVHRLSGRLYSGSSPEGDEGFRSLRRLGVKTVISVDGARPDVAGARRHGLRYVHLPVGYDGIPEAQALRIAKAVRDLPGLVYVHCHHGLHRGPAAAAAARRCLDEGWDADAAVAWLRTVGTDARYTGLYAAVRRLRRPAAAELDRVPADFPEAAGVPGLVQLMARVDAHWDNLRRVRAGGWETPPAHPDVDPPHEAVQLAELYREAARLPEVRARPEEFRRWLAEAEGRARELEKVLRGGAPSGAVDAPAAERALGQAGASCTRCHGRYRDVPQTPASPRP